MGRAQAAGLRLAAGRRDPFVDPWVDPPVTEAGGVRQKLPQGDLAARGTQPDDAVRDGAVEDVQVLKVGQQLAERRVETELAALDQLQGGDRGDRLGHGGDPEHRVRGHGLRSARRAMSGGRLIGYPATVHRERDRAGDAAPRDRRVPQLLEFGVHRRRQSPNTILAMMLCWISLEPA